MRDYIPLDDEKRQHKNDPQNELIQKIESLELEMIMRSIDPVAWQRSGEGFGLSQEYMEFQVHFIKISKVKETTVDISAALAFILFCLPTAFDFTNT